MCVFVHVCGCLRMHMGVYMFVESSRGRMISVYVRMCAVLCIHVSGGTYEGKYENT